MTMTSILVGVFLHVWYVHQSSCGAHVLRFPACFAFWMRSMFVVTCASNLLRMCLVCLWSVAGSVFVIGCWTLILTEYRSVVVLDESALRREGKGQMAAVLRASTMQMAQGLSIGLRGENQGRRSRRARHAAAGDMLRRGHSQRCRLRECAGKGLPQAAGPELRYIA